MKTTQPLNVLGRLYNPNLKPRIAYCDGGLISTPGNTVHNPSNLGCTWAYVLVDESGEFVCKYAYGGVITQDARNFAGIFLEYCDLVEIESNLAELVAMVKLLQNLPEDFAGRICTDSKNTVGRVFGLDGKLYAMRNVPDRLIDLLNAAKSRLRNFDQIQPVLLDGHPTIDQLLTGMGKRGNPVSEFNVLCDELGRMVNQGYGETKAIYDLKRSSAGPGN